MILKRDPVRNKGQAENILDRAYTDVITDIFCNFFRHWDRPNKDYLAVWVSTTEETIKAYPVSKWTRKITLNPEEYIGQSITEVGISDTTDEINTHAHLLLMLRAIRCINGV